MPTRERRLREMARRERMEYDRHHRSAYRHIMAAKAAGKCVDQIPNRLPAEPFRSWYLNYRDSSRSTEQIVIESLGVQDRRIREVMNHRQHWLSTEVVDKMLTNADRVVEVDGRPIFTLDDLYPELAA